MIFGEFGTGSGSAGEMGAVCSGKTAVADTTNKKMYSSEKTTTMSMSRIGGASLASMSQGSPSDPKDELFLMLLGSAGVGKSTIFKQVQVQYAHGFERKELLAAKKSIFLNLANCMSTLVKLQGDVFVGTNIIQDEVDELIQAETTLRYTDLDTPLEEFDTDEEADKEVLRRESVRALSTAAVDERVLQARRWRVLMDLWAQDKVKQAFQEHASTPAFRAEQGLGLLSAPPDCCRYLLDRLEHFQKPTALPSTDDMLRLRRSTEGTEETDFEVSWINRKDRIREKLCSVGGQIHERAAWSQVAEENGNLSGVIFVLSPCEFATPPPTEISSGEGNNMLEMQLQLLEQVAVSEKFEYTPICVLLNKIDLLPGVLRNYKFKDHFKAFKEPGNELDDVLSWIGARAARRVKKARKKKRDEGNVAAGDNQRYFPSTKVVEVCALDADLVQKTFEMIATSHLQGSLREAGFL